jgi:hypothetical protein
MISHTLSFCPSSSIRDGVCCGSNLGATAGNGVKTCLENTNDGTESFASSCLQGYYFVSNICTICPSG